MPKIFAIPLMVIFAIILTPVLWIMAVSMMWEGYNE